MRYKFAQLKLNQSHPIFKIKQIENGHEFYHVYSAHMKGNSR